MKHSHRAILVTCASCHRAYLKRLDSVKNWKGVCRICVAKRMGTRIRDKIFIPAKCHSDRKHYIRGMCRACYEHAKYVPHGKRGGVRRFSEIELKMVRTLRRRMATALKRNYKTSRTLDILGCSLKDFRIYLETKFEPEMTWENYGSVWHIDHIIPCAIFDMSKPAHQKRCFHFSNMQPLFAADNWRKHAKVLTNQFNLL